MRGLLDVNVLIALFDPDHAFHERAHVWLSESRGGWASCPLTENGLVRVMSNRAYSRVTSFVPTDLVRRLEQFVAASDHEFWPDDLSLRDQRRFSIERIHSGRHVTDSYLLALAVRNRGCFVTLDRGILLQAVPGASARNLCSLGD